MTNSFIAIRRDGKISTEFEIGGFGTDDPFAATRRIAYIDEDGTAAGSASLQGQRALDRFPHWELMIVTSGVLEFDFDVSRVTVSAGGAVLINRGAHVLITAKETANWIFCAAVSDKLESIEPATLVLLDRHAQLFPSAPPAAAVLISPKPDCRAHEFFNVVEIGFSGGMWDSTPYTRKIVPHKNHELMHLTRGSVTLTNALGRSEKFSAGDTVFVPRGAAVSWSSAEHVAKIYCSRAAI
jgi:uncharacterized cupin superfamily protein